MTNLDQENSLEKKIGLHYSIDSTNILFATTMIEESINFLNLVTAAQQTLSDLIVAESYPSC